MAKRLSKKDLLALSKLSNIDRRLAAVGQPWDGSACADCTEVHHPTQACRPADVIARAKAPRFIVPQAYECPRCWTEFEVEDDGPTLTNVEAEARCPRCSAAKE